MGWLADRFGRKPPMIAGLLVGCFAVVGFGASDNLYWAVAMRGIQGMAGSLSAVCLACLRDYTDDTNQTQAMSIMSSCWGIGNIIGPIIGGFLAFPDRRWPTVFGHGIWPRYPALLPCLFIAVWNLVALAGCVFFIHETGKQAGCLTQLRKMSGMKRQSTMDEVEAQLATDRKRKAKSNVTLWSLMRQPGLPSLVIARGSVGATAVALQECFPLWASSPPGDGGLGLTSAQVGSFLMVFGVSLVFFSLFCVPAIIDRAGARATAWIFMLMFGVAVVLLPFVRQVTPLDDSTDGLPWVAWITLSFLFCLRALGGNTSFCAFGVLVNNACTKEFAGRMNGLSSSQNSVNRAALPLLFGLLLGWTQSNGLPFPFDYHLSFLGSGLLVIVCAFVAWRGIPASMDHRMPEPISPALLPDSGPGVLPGLRLDATEDEDEMTLLSSMQTGNAGLDDDDNLSSSGTFTPTTAAAGLATNRNAGHVTNLTESTDGAASSARDAEQFEMREPARQAPKPPTY
eukprot:NODE_725_length_1682_cov_57.333119_g715_i0.p1 GENE.NODE_725_length_1682_cov_57.333119_g715_i0~~NODE_725_length_1682_cov_57.333119_g715_i0.p1  ORF type:complete len:521 (-),score=101.64 NODE_725_length_1682_cov_57.333119_g715_i0:118-1653(-)